MSVTHFPVGIQIQLKQNTEMAFSHYKKKKFIPTGFFFVKQRIYVSTNMEILE